MPGLLPVGRPVISPQARAEVARAWNKAALPTAPGRDTSGILAAAERGDLSALIVAGVDPADLPDPAAALRALEATPFIISLELRASAVTDRADVVFPVSAVAEKAGTFVNWEGRGGTFAAALKVPAIRDDLYVLGAIADEMDVHLGLPDAAAARVELAALGTWKGEHPLAPAVLPPSSALAQDGPTVRLATWHQLLDNGRLQDGEPYLAGTARPVVARMSAATAREAGVADGDKVTVESTAGSVTVPVAVTEMADGVVWLPANSTGSAVRADLVAGHGSRVTLRRPQ